MKKYQILFFITERNIEGVEESFYFVPWKLGEDFSIYKRKPSSRYKNVLTAGNVSVVVLGRDCKTDYLPFCTGFSVYSIGNKPECTYSFLEEIKLNKIPDKLYSLCRFFMYQIDNLVNAKVYLCSECGHKNLLNRFSRKICDLCRGKMVLTIRVEKDDEDI